MKKIVKQLFILTATVLMLFGVSVLASAEDEARGIIDNGACGENAEWVLYDDGELVISGEGSMENYTFSKDIPWQAYYQSITKVTVDPGIINIGDRALSSLYYVTEFSLPETVTAIGEYSLAWNSRASKVILPDSVETIGANAFYHSGINRIVIPTNVTIIRTGTFEGCSELNKVVLPETVVTIQDNAFSECNNINEVYYEGTQEQWNAIAFGSGNGYLKNNTNITFSYTCHQYEVTQVASTCQSEGYDRYVCKICGDTYLDNFTDKIAHSTTNGKCDMCGKFIVEELSTLYLGVSLYNPDDGIEQWVLENDRAEIISTDLSIIQFGTLVQKTYSVTIKGLAVGENTLIFIFNGETIDSIEIEIMPHTHSQETIPGKAATCTEKGLTDGSKCSVCGEILTAQTEIPALGHDYVETVTEATCVENGSVKYVCSHCGDTYTETIPATEHVHGEWVTVTPAEIGQEGLERQTCAVCGEILDEREIPALFLSGDANGDGKVTASDARIILRVVANLEPMTEYYLLAGDIDQSGTLTAADARKILRKAANLE